MKIALVEQKNNVHSYVTSTSDQTLAEWLDYWMNVVIKDRLRPSSKASYDSKIRNYILPVLGEVKLCLLKKKSINDLVLQLVSQNYSENTIKTTISILKSSLNYAVQNDYLEKNPCSNVSVSNNRMKKTLVLSVQQQERLEVAALKERGCSPVLLSLSTGMRIGELCGLKWEDIDFDEDMISIKRTLQRVRSVGKSSKTEIVIGAPKTKSSYRNIPLPSKLKGYLLEKKAMQLSDYVVAIKSGYTEPRTITYHFKKLLKEAEINHVNFHALRHTFATRCIENGVDITTVSKLLGHTSTKMTLDVYTDSLWENRKNAMSIIDNVIFK